MGTRSQASQPDNQVVLGKKGFQLQRSVNSGGPQNNPGMPVALNDIAARTQTDVVEGIR
jgi:hypothetical protein